MEGDQLPVCVSPLGGMREHNEKMPVELWRVHGGRLVVRAWNECGNNATDVDLLDLLEWVRCAPKDILGDVPNGNNPSGDWPRTSG